jgi:beta-glucanase (GH16 family)
MVCMDYRWIACVVLLCSSFAMAADWKLVWSDEFNYTGQPDPAKWGYEEGYVRNNEAQYYTVNRLENARVENGCLVIEGRKDNMANPEFDAKGKGPTSRPTLPYTAASIHTRGKAAWLFGRVEVRAKIPSGLGVWPAAWMLGTNITKIGWPRCGEIDIMEFVGKDAGRIHGTLHWGTSYKKGEHKASGKAFPTTRPFDDFHIYAVEWYPDRIDFFFDDTKYHTVKAEDVVKASGDNPFLKEQYLILNLALGGDWGGKIDDANLPQRYLIDYVRVYQQATPPAPAAEAKGR